MLKNAVTGIPTPTDSINTAITRTTEEKDGKITTKYRVELSASGAIAGASIGARVAGPAGAAAGAILGAILG